MHLREDQAKGILKEYGIRVPEGEIAANPVEARFIAERIGCPVMLKAQIRAGGRAKAGGIREAKTPVEADKIAFEMLGKRLVTSQTSAEGVIVNKLLVEKRITNVVKEFYVAISIDEDCPVVIISEYGGTDIESMPKEKISKLYINPLGGCQDFQKGTLAYDLSTDPVLFMRVVYPLYQLSQEKDCLLAEINPVVWDGRFFWALDAKIEIDDSALSRHSEIKALREFENSLEEQAAKCGLDYVQLEGDIGCIGNGAGLTMATMDTVYYSGGEPGIFLDVGGGASPEQIECALRVLSADPQIKAIFINIFGGIFRTDIFAATLVKFAKENNLKIPLVLRVKGNKMEEGKKLLMESGLNFFMVESMEEGAKKVVELVKEPKEK